MNINWSDIRFRASSFGNLMTESKDKKEPIGKTCQGELLKIYAEVVYGRKKEVVTKAMRKGIECEQDAIAMYSIVEGEVFYKNEEKLENLFFTGHPDIYAGKDIRNAIQVDDIKVSEDMHTFLPKLIEGLDKAYEAQLNVYFDLCNCSKGNVVYALVNTPEAIIQEELYYLLKNMNVVTEESPEFRREAIRLRNELIYDDIPIQERIIKIPVERNDWLIQKMKEKVPVMRQWLEDFHKKHLSLYPKEVLV